MSSKDTDTTDTALRVVREGERVCCCGRDTWSAPSTRWSYWTGKVYEAKARRRDGLLTWRLVDTYGGTRSGREPSAKFRAELRAKAPHPWSDAPVHHGDMVLPAIVTEGGAHDA